MASIEFLRPRLQGTRFDDGQIPLDILGDLAVLEVMVLEVAKWRYLQDHPDRQRLPRGFTKETELRLIAVEEGSATPVIVLSTTKESEELVSEIPHLRYYEEAARDIIQFVDGAGRGILPSDSDFPRKFYRHFNKIGRNLRDDESIEFVASSSEGTTARLDKEVRLSILTALDTGEVTREVSVRGFVSEADQYRMTFQLRQTQGPNLILPIREEHYDIVMQTFGDYRNGLRVLVRGAGAFNQENRLQSLTSVEHITALDPLDVPTRLGELKLIEDGWLEGGGLAPTREGLDWLSYNFDLFYEDDAALPYIYPTEDGGVRMEWSVASDAMILEIDLGTRTGEWLWFDRNSEDSDELELNLDDSASWEWLSSRIREKFQAGGE